MDEPRTHYIQSEVGQKKKKIYINVDIYIESRKMVLMNLFAGKEWRCRFIEWTVNTVGKGERETNGECSINLYALSHVK